MKRSLSLVLLALCLWPLNLWAWQQRVAYQIEARLDTADHYLYASQNLRYFNNSPDTLKFVWFHLYPNAYRDRNTDFAREAKEAGNYKFWRSGPKDKGYIELNQLSADGQALGYEYGPDLTEIKVPLNRPLAPGESLDFFMDYRVKIPKIFSRLGHAGAHYEISQWYPKIVVYDSLGWHPDGYHYNGEFYGDYGSFDVGLTLPRNMKIGATGIELVNPYDSLDLSSDSGSYRFFYADDVHDFAWCADPAYQETTETYKGVDIKVLCLPKDRKKWANVMQYSKDALDYYGRWYGEYPYSTLTVCDGDMAAGGGMEYPNLVIISSGEDKITRSLENVVMHEIGHQWFYGILGNNEMDEPWLDEGINSFSEERYFEEKYGPKGNMWAKKFLQKLMPEFSDRYVGYFLCYLYAANKMEQPITTKACLVDEQAQYAVTAYKKPALMIWWLKGFLGDSAFDAAMQAYCRKFRFKHVSAENFLAVMDSVSGKNVSQPLRAWLGNASPVDYSITQAARIGEQEFTYLFKLSRRGDFRVPVKFEAWDGVNRSYYLDWSAQRSDTNFYLQMDGKLQWAALDPNQTILEINRWNNRWPRKVSYSVFPRLPDFGAYRIFAFPLPCYDAVNGFRLGVISHGAYLADGDPMIGKHQWTFSPYYGFKSKQFSYSAGYQTPITDLLRPPRIYASGGKAFDLRWASVGVKRNWGRYLMQGPTERFNLKLEYNQMVDYGYRFWDARDIIPAKIFMLTGERGYATSNPFISSDFRLAATLGYLAEPAWDIRNFLRAELEYQNRFYFHKWLRPSLRLFAGSIQGQAPKQEQFFLSGAFKSQGLDDLIISYQGGFSAQEHYHIDGGANLPGSYGRHLHGNATLGANLSVPVWPGFVSVFGDVGSVKDSWQEMKAKYLYADVGVTVSLGPVRALFPLWINRPLEGEKRLDWKRWKVGLGGSFGVKM
ncbi:M1 family metallopeptidase [candidate division TA06 bacterium]|uniref:M1 family metallopeptidase n=1 Tax=candidate division TA06 bacterium TaxID=2250710 RepID=A0A933IBU1_UNCT6|nr:M1 family metallopeptidase [candidate division TA06 bacterium]